MDGAMFPSPERARFRRGRLSSLPVERWRLESSKDPWRRLWEDEQERLERFQVTITIDDADLAKENMRRDKKTKKKNQILRKRNIFTHRRRLVAIDRVVVQF